MGNYILACVEPDRSRPRLWFHDYLHLRPIARDLERRIRAAVAERAPRRVLDVGCGESPYRRFFGDVESYVRVDAAPQAAPDVIARGEALPFADAAFDMVLSTQALQLASDPAAVAAESARVARPGARVWVTTPRAWPYDAATEHRLGVPQLGALFGGLRVVEVVPQGGMLAFPCALWNVMVREAVLAAERRLGAPAKVLRVPAAGFYLVSNLVGRALERASAAGPGAKLLSFLDARLPANVLVAAERPR